MGPGPPRAIRTSRRWDRDLHVPIQTPLSSRLSYLLGRGSGAATCHADAGAGASLPLEAPSPNRIKCEWLRRALLPLGTGQILSVHTMDHQPSCRIKCWWLGRALPEQGIGYPLTGWTDMT